MYAIYWKLGLPQTAIIYYHLLNKWWNLLLLILICTLNLANGFCDLWIQLYLKRLIILKQLTLSLRRIFYFFLIELQYLRQHLTCFVDTAEPMPFTLISNIRETNEFYSKINQKCFRGSFLASRMFRKDPTCMVQEVALNKI